METIVEEAGTPVVGTASEEAPSAEAPVAEAPVAEAPVAEEPPKKLSFREMALTRKIEHERFNIEGFDQNKQAYEFFMEFFDSLGDNLSARAAADKKQLLKQIAEDAEGREFAELWISWASAELEKIRLAEMDAAVDTVVTKADEASE